jgi:hypothetical protein
MSTVISQIGDEYLKGGPTVIGMSELENRECWRISYGPMH